MPSWSRIVLPVIAAETTQALRHVERILRAGDATLADVVKVTVHLTEWDAMNRAYVDVFGAATPARLALRCASLLFGARIELDCIAYRPSD